MRIYTRAGDDGRSALAGGEQLPKDDPHFQALGDLDELNAWIGLCRARLGATPEAATLAEAQRALMDISAAVAGAGSGGEPSVTSLEAAIDRLEAELRPVRVLVLPGRCETGAGLHVARAVCRRAERTLVTLTEGARTPDALRYLNRLSDYLFVLARLANARAGVAEEPYA
jgi:cob(I)alamin adenosyltransferase